LYDPFAEDREPALSVEIPCSVPNDDTLVVQPSHHYSPTSPGYAQFSPPTSPTCPASPIYAPHSPELSYSPTNAPPSPSYAPISPVGMERYSPAYNPTSPRDDPPSPIHMSTYSPTKKASSGFIHPDRHAQLTGDAAACARAQFASHAPANLPPYATNQLHTRLQSQPVEIVAPSRETRSFEGGAPQSWHPTNKRNRSDNNIGARPDPYPKRRADGPRNHFQCLKPGCNNAWQGAAHRNLSQCNKCQSQVWAIECLNLRTQSTNLVHAGNAREHSQQQPAYYSRSATAAPPPGQPTKHQHLSAWKNVLVEASRAVSSRPVQKPLQWN